MARAPRGHADPWADVRRDVASGELKLVYLLAGQERFLVRRAYDLLYKAGVGGGPRGFNEQVFQGESASAASIVGACNTVPMMASRRVVVVRNVDKLKQEGQDVLAAYCAKPSPTTLLLLLTSPENPKLDGRRKLVKTVKKGGRLCEFKKIYGRALREWIEAEAESLGKRLPSRGAGFLEGIVGNDLGALRNALVNASLYVGEADAIKLESLERVVSGNRQEALWDLLDAVLERSPEDVQRNLAMLYRQESKPISVLFLAMRRVRQISAVQDSMDEGLSQDDALRNAGVKGMAWKWKGKLWRYSAMELGDAVSTLIRAESDMKGGKRIDDRWTLEQALLHIVRRPARR
jgi:DNA polymerase-3 subunit delta